MSEDTIQIKPTPKNLNEFMSEDIYEHFPFSGIRDGQKECLEVIKRAYEENKKFIIIEAPVGSGKSGVGIAAASFAKTQPSLKNFESGSYILSPQKSLVTQYLNDFAPMGLKELKGRSNFECTTFIDSDTQEPVDCEIGAELCRSGKIAQILDDEDIESGDCSFCPYKEAKLQFCASPLGVTNFAYYLHETIHAGQLLPRKMLVLDEAHNLSDQILSLADISITRFRCEEIGIDFNNVPVIKPGQNYKGAEWIRETFKVAANATIMKWESDLTDFKSDNDNSAFTKLSKKLTGLRRFMGKIMLFLDSVDNSENDWIVYTDDTKGSSTLGCLIIKPLTATLFADEYVFSKADKVLIMSATIGNFDFFMRDLGIDPKNTVTCRLDSDFPIENRPIFLKPVANMSSTKVGCPDCSSPENSGVENHKGAGCSRCWRSGQVPSIDVAMPKVSNFLNSILSHKNYVGKKGIVHGHSFKVTQYMAENVTKDNKYRVVTHSNMKGSRDEAIIKHIEAEQPTVLFSPSMAEGLDLKDELSRFSVIVKVPFGALDPYTKARMQRDPEWYPSKTAATLVQATGRSNRHKEDKAHHYILDAAILNFLSRYSHLFPKWWLDSVVWP